MIAIVNPNMKVKGRACPNTGRVRPAVGRGSHFKSKTPLRVECQYGFQIFMDARGLFADHIPLGVWERLEDGFVRIQTSFQGEVLRDCDFLG
jgi:hypothetical protein